MSAPATLALWRAGEEQLHAVLDRLVDLDLDAPSLLPGWPRRQLLAHVARNADAVGNLLTWARTGEPTPMYASPEAREEGIAATALLPAPALLEDCHAAAGRFCAQVDALPPAAWATPVVTAQGRTVPASEVLWMRAREAWVHGVDLDAGTGFADLPEPVLLALVDDVHRSWARRDQSSASTVVSGVRTWGDGPVHVAGALPDVAAWVTGRAVPAGLQAAGPLPPLPTWI